MATVTVSRAEDLGPALRQVRRREGITQTSLSRLAAVGRQWLNAFELGDKPTVPLAMVMRVATALGTTVSLTPLHATRRLPEADRDPIDLQEILERVSR